MKIIINENISSKRLDFGDDEEPRLMLHKFAVGHETAVFPDKYVIINIRPQKITLDEADMQVFLDGLADIIPDRIGLIYSHGMCFDLELLP